ncbi:TIM barrel protein [Haloferula chungangensis]|uniref:TIM barrel protein n=1 Tax=Haloferula chungangensis TaxID=1048331 RepID=A0ABW2L7U5_9BACT
MRTAVTLSRVAESAAGPFVFHDPLAEGFKKAASAGFDDVELFFPGPDAVELDAVKALCDQHGLGVAAVGTGAGMVKHGLSLTDPDPAKRDAALEFIQAMIEFGGKLGAPAILGSMQGRWGGEVSRDQALGWLADALRLAGETAGRFGVPFIYEPLNRYESNLINHQAVGAKWIEAESLSNIVLLADLFHMNIEEVDLAQAILDGGRHIGHVHYADSNRQAMGFGHTDPAPIIAALNEVGYRGTISAEVFPLPDAETAARQTIQSIRQFLPGC